MMASTGRKHDSIWVHFEKVKIDGAKLKKAKCKECGMLVTALVGRMKVHRTNCHDDDLETEIINPAFASSSSSFSSKQDVSSSSTPPSGWKQGQLTAIPLYTKTTSSQKKQLDAQCARFLYATNSAFRTADHPEFIKFVTSLRPGYFPPNREQIRGKLLDAEYDDVQHQIKKELENKIVCLSVDGWSNVGNDPIICACVTDPQSNKVFLVDTIDTTGQPHTSEYLSKITENCIVKCNQKFLCQVGSVVTDNANNMKLMRTLLSASDNVEVKHVFTYGCSAHIANLLCKDIRDDSIIEKVKTVVKYFRNHHNPKAKYKQAGGKNLVLPCDVRWNTTRNCLNSFVENYIILNSVTSTHKHVFDESVVDIILENNLITSAQFLIQKLDAVGEALNKLQSDSCYLSDAYEIWLNLGEFFSKKDSDSIMDVNVDFMNFTERYKLAISVYHTMAYMLDPRFRGKRATQAHKEEAMKYLQRENPLFISEILKFNAESSPYISALFDSIALQNTNPYVWWKAIAHNNGDILPQFTQFCLKLFSCTASSAGIERLFSTFGVVHTKLRNRLGVSKAAKLVTIFKNLNYRKGKPQDPKAKTKNQEGINMEDTLDLDSEREEDIISEIENGDNSNNDELMSTSEIFGEDDDMY